MTEDDDDIDIDVCLHCGGYFGWTKHHREVAERTGFVNGQRCIRCMTDECWIERGDPRNHRISAPTPLADQADDGQADPQRSTISSERLDGQS